MKSSLPPISLAASQLSETRHVCAFFNNDEEEYQTLLPFIKDGFKAGDKAVHVLNPKQHSDHWQQCKTCYGWEAKRCISDCKMAKLAKNS